MFSWWGFHRTAEKVVRSKVIASHVAYSRWSGIESMKLFNAESSSATVFSSQSEPVWPSEAFDLLMEYYKKRSIT